MSDRMPDRPLNRMIWTNRGDHDDPPATGAQPPWARRRRSRLQRAQYDDDTPPVASASTSASASASDPADTSQDTDPSTVPQSRRRQRSDSPDSQYDAEYSAERRRGYDELRQRLMKRRRLDPDVLSVSCPPIKYGYYGQVEPGRLKMFMVSCDGGQHMDHRFPAIDLGPHNVLKTDKSVYCSERKNASIILRHADDTPFSLTQLSIIAPEHGFTAPVKEGVVYVGMTMEALSKYTDKPRMSSGPPPYSEDPERSHNNTERLSLPSPPHRQPRIERPRRRPRPGSPRFNSYTTTTNDTDLGPEDPSSPEVLDFRLRRMQRRHWRDRRLHRSLPMMDDFSAFTDSPAQMSTVEADAREHFRSLRPDILGFLDSSTPDAETVCRSPRREHEPEHESYLDDEGNAPYDDAAVNYARFQIDEEAHKVTVQFRTPVSGRFILLNLASTPHADNVDVQSIMARGYAGPRFFPAVQPR